MALLYKVDEVGFGGWFGIDDGGIESKMDEVSGSNEAIATVVPGPKCEIVESEGR